MKIILLTSSLGSGGAERVATTLSNAWAARGDTVTLIPTFSGGGQPFYEVSKAVELINLADVVGIRRKTLWTYALRLYGLRRLIKERKPDVIVSFLPNVNVAAIFSSAFLRVPVIICERSDPSTFPYSSFWTALCKLTYRFADMLTVQTDTVARKVPDIFSGLRKVRAVPNPLPEGVLTALGRQEKGRKILLSLGRLSPEKQVDKVLSAFSELVSRFDDWDLYIYGEGPLRYSLDARIEELGLRSRVFLRGGTNQPWEIMARSDAFVMTSKYEGFPNALLEEMGVGLPCVVFDCPSGPREITRDGKDALLIPLNDHEALVAALANVMGDKDLRNSLAIQARDSVRNRFSLAAVLYSWDVLFKEVGAIP